MKGNLWKNLFVRCVKRDEFSGKKVVIIRNVRDDTHAKIKFGGVNIPEPVDKKYLRIISPEPTSYCKIVYGVDEGIFGQYVCIDAATGLAAVMSVERHIGVVNGNHL